MSVRATSTPSRILSRRVAPGASARRACRRMNGAVQSQKTCTSATTRNGMSLPGMPSLRHAWRTMASVPAITTPVMIRLMAARRRGGIGRISGGRSSGRHDVWRTRVGHRNWGERLHSRDEEPIRDLQPLFVGPTFGHPRRGSLASARVDVVSSLRRGEVAGSGAIHPPSRSPPTTTRNRLVMSSRLTSMLLVFLFLPHAAAGQEVPLPGRLVARDAVPGDSAHHVAAYFPSGFDRSRAVPVLFVLDPRGRGELALRLFAGGAERHGWLVVSSYNSASDTDGNPNVDAMNAMLAWTQQNARMDTARIYLAGFSGTARIAWGLAAELRPRVAGMFGTGGGVAFSAGGPEMAFGADSSFAFFGSAGTTDFNYDEMRGLATRLRLARVPSRIAWFRGPHSWPPRSLCEQAVDWLELRAMLGGRRAIDTAFVSRALGRDLAYADSLERAGQWDAAEP